MDMDKAYNMTEIDGVWVYRQPGGCIEIGQQGPGGIGGSQDLIHMCSHDDVRKVIDALTKYVNIPKD